MNTQPPPPGAATRRRLSCGLLTGLLAAAAGCVAPRVPPEIATPYSPNLGVLYHPFASDEARTVARPQPDRSGWTSGQMRLDLRRMAAAHVDTVFVVVHADGIEPFHIERLLHFVRIADSVGNAPLAALWVKFRTEETAQSLQRVLSLLVQNGAIRLPGWVQVEGRPLVVVESSTAGIPRHPAFTFRRAGSERSTWAPASGPLRQPAFGDGGRQAMVSGGYWDANTGEWIVPRDKGRTFRDQFWQAVQRRPHFLVISSWDNVRRGDFLVPNTLDGDQAYSLLVTEGRWLDGLAECPPTKPRPRRAGKW